MMLRRRMAAIGVATCMVAPVAFGSSPDRSWRGADPASIHREEAVFLPEGALLAQVRGDQRRAPYLSMQESVLREVAQLPYEEGIKYGALTLLAAQPWSPATSAVAAGALKTEIVKDILFAVLRGIANSDPVKGAVLSDPIKRKQVELAMRVVEGTWDLHGFLADITRITGMSDADLLNFTSTLPSSITDALDASQAYVTTVSGIGFMETVALELAEECDFEAARTILQRADHMLKNDVLPKVVRHLNDKIELIIGYRVSSFPEDLPVEWWKLPYRDEKYAEAMGDTYFWAAVAYRQGIRLAGNLPRRLRDLKKAEEDYRRERHAVEQQLDEAEKRIDNCEFDRAYQLLSGIRNKYISRSIPLPYFGRDIAKSHGCWGWAESRFNALKDRHIRETAIAWEPMLADRLAAEGRGALAECRIDQARFALGQLRNFGTHTRERCADTKAVELQKALDDIINRSLCKGRTASDKPPPPAPQPASSCAPAADSQAQKKALHARIGQYLKFRKDGGDQWHPDHTMRAGYSVGSVESKATASELAAMAKLVDDYHSVYERYWAYQEGQRPHALQAIKNAEIGRDLATATRLRQELGKSDLEASRAKDDGIRAADEEFKAAMKRARDMCRK